MSARTAGLFARSKYAKPKTHSQVELRNRIQVDVTTANELSDEEKPRSSHELQTKLSCEMDMNHKIDEDIIGGIVVRVGDKL